MLDKLPHLEDDGLFTPEVGAWAELKYRLVQNYANMFATSMKNNWDVRVYIDLFAGAGRGKLEGSSVIVPASPLLALNVKDKFDKYIFCEQDQEKLEVLKQRVKEQYPNVQVAFITGDVNTKAEEIISEIPSHNANQKVLSFCFADPYKLKNLNFNLIKKLSERFVDFLVLIPSWMDAHRNCGIYSENQNTVIEDFTGSSSWRDEWKTANAKGQDFGAFVADLFGRNMGALRYLYKDLGDMEQAIFLEKNFPLYHLGFFCRNKRGMQFWNETRKYSKDQLDIFNV